MLSCLLSPVPCLMLPCPLSPVPWCSRAMRSTAVIIVNYRTAPLVLDCLRSLEPELQAEPGCRVIVVDNDSKDGSFEQIEEAIHANAWAGWAQVVPAGRNAGFAAGNNFALRSLLQSPDPPAYTGSSTLILSSVLGR